MPGVLPVIAVVAVGTVATAIDLRTRRVPNALTFGTGAAGLALAFLEGGGLGAAAIIGGLIGLALMLVNGAAVGLIPAWRAMRLDIVDALAGR